MAAFGGWGGGGVEATGCILFVIVELICMKQEIPTIPLNTFKINNKVKLSYI